MALAGNGSVDVVPGIYCQCTNEACGALLRMANDYKPGQVRTPQSTALPAFSPLKSRNVE